MGVAPLLAALVLLLPAAPAFAGTAWLETGSDGGAATARVLFRAAPGEGNRVRVQIFRGNDYGGDRFTGRGVVGFEVWDRRISPGRGCEALSRGSIACPLAPDTQIHGPIVHLGTRGDEVTIDIPGPDTQIYGGPGEDTLTVQARGREGAPFRALLHGGPGNDTLEATGTLHGGAGNDSLASQDGATRFFGGPGHDEISGSDRADVIVPGPGADNVFAALGADVIRASDGRGDRIYCDEGRDLAELDPFDMSDVSLVDPPFQDCERLRRNGAARAVPTRFEVWEGEPYALLTVGCPPDGAPLCVGDVSLMRRGRVIGRSAIRGRAGEWVTAEFPFGQRRMRRLLDKELVAAVRSQGRNGQPLTATLRGSLYEPEPPDDGAASARANRQ